MSITAKRQLESFTFGLFLFVFTFLVARPALADGGGELATPGWLVISAGFVGIVVRAVRQFSDTVAESKKLTGLVAVLVGAGLGALGLAGHVGNEGISGAIYAGVLAGCLAYVSAALVGSKGRLE